MLAPAPTLSMRVRTAFDKLRRAVDGLAAVGLADPNGLPVASLGPAGEKTVSMAMGALLVSTAERATESWGLCLPRRNS